MLDDPKKLNAIDLEMCTALGNTMASLSKNTELRCVVLRGAGGKAFAAGADISRFAEERSTREQALEYHSIIDIAMDAIYECLHPTVALIEGVCVGGGLEVAACCDVRICGKSSRFGIPIKNLGFTMDYGELGRVMQVIGPAATRELLLEGQVFGAGRAKEIGFVNRVVDDLAVSAEAYEVARRVGDGAPIAQRFNKKFISRLCGPEPIQPAEHEETYHTITTDDFREGIHAFLSKRHPVFKGR